MTTDPRIAYVADAIRDAGPKASATQQAVMAVAAMDAWNEQHAAVTA